MIFRIGKSRTANNLRKVLMSKIYDGIVGLDIPEFKSGVEKFDAYNARCEEYVRRVKALAKSEGTCPEAGKEIRFPVGDGYARYVIQSMKPVRLIHLAVHDRYHFEYVGRLTASDIRKELSAQASLDRLFSKRKGNEDAL